MRGRPGARRLDRHIAVFVLIALLAPLLSPGDPYEQSLRLRFRPPVWEERGLVGHTRSAPTGSAGTC